MLEANKSLLFESIFSVYNRNLLKRRFNSLQVSGLKLLNEKDNKTPLIIYANHSSWWDGLIAFQISRQSGLDSFIMMEEKQLKKLRLFRKLGAFSVVRENARQALESVNYSAKMLKENPRRTLWIFPQGEIAPNDLRPLRFFNGLAKIIKRLKNCSIVSFAIRYEFLGAYKPDIFVRIEYIKLFSDDVILKPKEISNFLSGKLTDNLEKLKTDILNGNFSNYEKIC